MKNIFVYVGSKSGEKSSTLGVVKDIIDKVIEIIGEENINVSIYSPSLSKINSCYSCNNCFYEGNCIQDENDDMEEIKNNLENADIVIFASPVYMHNVSGDMKIFIDRISYWSHLLKLRGKVGLAISTSSGNGLDITTSYINKVMNFLGIKVVGALSIVPYKKNEKYHEIIENCAISLVEYMNGKEIVPDELLEAIFLSGKQMVMQQKDVNETAEYIYWKESGMLECNTFKEALKI
ncbi:flavodoxin family protein (plasmid) [Clostridium estertheticum]|uniref:flavodoxin family protein n=1 Tax=Clostridium estertheticum TaxID=238834 RepID=UPI001C7D00FC|nr:flavodoxin family protein [Clostridium estertheticum]MBX4262547.1 flavodoxin family protein [Clostridium estertheticum]WLC73341.1 flavodoxin family protein [Clostridium estertheticum]